MSHLTLLLRRFSDAGAAAAGVEQDNEALLKAGVASLRGYITLCDAVLIPAPATPEGESRTVDMVPGGYVNLAVGSFVAIAQSLDCSGFLHRV